MFGVRRRNVARYEAHVAKLDNRSGFIDLFWPGVLIVEQKSAGRDLRKAYDHSRLAFTQIRPDEKKHSAVAFLQAAVAYYRSLGIPVERVMTDNGSCYRSPAFARACRDLGLKHLRTRPYTPRTHGKAERFIQTALREWAYARAYESSQQRAQHLPLWLHAYNWHRPHSSLKAQPPISRLRLARDNLLRLHN